MHCDDKRTLYVLKEQIQKTWDEIEKSEFTQESLEDFNDAVTEYFEYKSQQ